MKKIIFRASLWLIVTIFGSMFILVSNGIQDMSELHRESLAFGLFIGFMSLSVNYIIPDKKE